MNTHLQTHAPISPIQPASALHDLQLLERETQIALRSADFGLAEVLAVKAITRITHDASIVFPADGYLSQAAFEVLLGTALINRTRLEPTSNDFQDVTAECATIFRNALEHELARTTPHPFNLARIHWNLATLNLATLEPRALAGTISSSQIQESNEVSIEHFTQVIKHAPRSEQPECVLLGIRSARSAAALTVQKDPARATEFYRQAFDMSERWLGPDERITQQTLQDLVFLLANQGRFVELAPLAERNAFNLQHISAENNVIPQTRALGAVFAAIGCLMNGRASAERLAEAYLAGASEVIDILPLMQALSAKTTEPDSARALRTMRRIYMRLSDAGSSGNG